MLAALPIFVPVAFAPVLIFAVPFNVDVPSTFTVPLKSELPFAVNTVPAVKEPPPITAVPRAAAPVTVELPVVNAPVTVADDIVVAPVTPSVPTSVVFPSTFRSASRSVLPLTFKVPPITVALVPEPILVVAAPVLLMSVGPRIVVVLAALPIFVPVVLAPVLRFVVPFVTSAATAVAGLPFNVVPF